MTKISNISNIKTVQQKLVDITATDNTSQGAFAAKRGHKSQAHASSCHTEAELSIVKILYAPDRVGGPHTA